VYSQGASRSTDDDSTPTSLLADRSVPLLRAEDRIAYGAGAGERIDSVEAGAPAAPTAVDAISKKKPKLKLKGDTAGAVQEDGTLAFSGTLKAGKKKLKTTEAFVSSSDGVAHGMLSAADGKKSVWTYTLDNASVQSLGAGQVVQEIHRITFKTKGAKTTTQDVVITITGSNDAPVITSAAAAQVAENGAAVMTVTSADADAGAAKTFFIAGGADAARFTINAATGALSFLSAPDFDALTDSGANNVYDVVVGVSDGIASATHAIAVTVLNVNEAPVITSNGGGVTAGVSVAENTTAVTTVTASDPDAGAAKTFAIAGGVDAGKFQINAATGALSFLSAPDFESPTDAGANNTYEVVVQVSDGGLVDTQAITVTVTNVSEGPNTAPVISSHGGQESALVHVAENTTIVTTVSAFDWEDDPITYSLLEEDDWTYFSVDPVTGILSFINAPNFEDTEHEETYLVTVIASDGSLTADQEIFIFVDDVNESGRTVIDLASLSAAQGFYISADVSNDYMGSSVALGDINGDGFADVLVGATNGDDGGSNAGEIYVIFGKAGTFGSSVGGGQVVDLTNDNPGTDGFGSADGFILQGASDGDNFGVSVAAGDVNRDGSVDVIGGALGHDADNKGAAYVYFGKTGGFGSTDAAGRAFVDLANDSVGDGFAAADGFLVTGNTANEQAGSLVSSAGDINGDGIGDFIVGARYGDDGGLNGGTVYVIFGKTGGIGTTGGDGRASLSLATLAAADGFVVAPDAADGIGRKGAVSGAGDLNGDGFDDLVVGAPNGGDGGTGAGEAYVIFGKSGTFGKTVGGRQVVDLTNDEAGDGFAAADGFIIQGGGTGHGTDLTGYSVSRAGDVNGDGLADIIVAAPRGDEPDPGLADTGEAYVVFGKATGFGTSVDLAGRAVLTLSTLTPSQGFLIRGEGVSDKLGTSVFEAGDFNGDGFDDIIVASPGGSASGEYLVVFGKSSGFGTVGGDGRAVILAETLNPSQGVVILGANTPTSTTVSGGGDVNGDGFDDVVIGVSTSSAATVVFGGAFGAGTTPVTTTGSIGAEQLIGGLGNDGISGGGGLDSIRTGKGDDRITVPDLGFRAIDGGNGTDTLVLNGAGATFDFTSLPNPRVGGIEVLDITGTGNNTLKLGLADALYLSDNPHAGFTGSVTAPKAIVIEADTGDVVQLVGDARGLWTKQADDRHLDGSAGGTYDIWSFTASGSHFVKLAIDADVSVVPNI